MIKLYLLRHAKSSHAAPGMEDHDRPLSERGRDDAHRLGGYLKQQRIQPHVVGCSTARRTRQTLEIVSLAAGWTEHEPQQRFDDHLYLASAATILRTIQGLAPDQATIMIIGHNPGIHEMALELSGASARHAPTIAEKFPTGSLAAFESQARAWADFSPAQTALTGFVRPRDLRP